MNNTAGKPTSLQQRGALTEQLALDHLLAAGLRLLARNVRYNSEVKFAIPETMFEWLSKPASGKASPPALHAEHQPVSNRRTP